MPNCGAVGCINRSTKNLSVSFDRVHNEERAQSPFQRTSISVVSILKKTISKDI